jgi:integrase
LKPLRVVYVHRSFTKGRLKCPKTEASRRAVPLQTIALHAIEHQAASRRAALVFPAERGGYLDLHNFRNREWKPAQLAAGIEPLRRIYDLRHTFATFALRAGISTFDLSRYMGASLTMIDRHYGHLARDGREHAIRLLDELSAGQRPPWPLVDAAWTPNPAAGATADNGTSS